MAKRLKDIEITHISLVKAGANGKSIIYKSCEDEPKYEKNIKLKKTDEEKGLIYGVVYSPDTQDSQGDMASAQEIIKAAYSFMKNRNTTNVDKQHDFKNVEAFVAESWIVKKGDSVFPDEKEGTWAVAIKLESEELKKAVKKGEIAGLSMAGTAQRKEDEFEKSESFTLADLTQALKKAFGSKEENKEKKGENLKKEELQEVLKQAVAPLNKEVEGLKKEVEALKKAESEIKQTLKKSKQEANLKTEKENEIGGIL